MDGNAAGTVSAKEAANAQQYLKNLRAKRKRQQEAKAKQKVEAKIRNAGRLSLAGLRAAAEKRRAAAA